VIVDNKVVHGEFVSIKTGGQAPCPRYGHTMSYLPVNNSLLLVGGRNDSMCKVNITPLLNDLHLFLLDQKVWIRVKYSYNSDRIENVCNHCMSVISDGENYEKILVFGGISNYVEGLTSESSSPTTTKKKGSSFTYRTPAEIAQMKSSLSNKSYIITVQQRSQFKNYFKEDPLALKKPVNPAHNIQKNEKLKSLMSLKMA